MSEYLSPQQMRFVEEMILDSSSYTAAAKRAGYSPKTAKSQAGELMANPKIKKAIDAANEEAIKRLGITKERILQELWLIARANPQDAIQTDEDGNQTIDLRSLTRDSSAGSEVIISTTSGDKKLKNVTVKTPKQSDRIAALTKIGQHLGMFTEKVEITNKLSLLELIEKSMEEDTKETNTST